MNPDVEKVSEALEMWHPMSQVGHFAKKAALVSTDRLGSRITELEAENEAGRRTLSVMDETLERERAHKASYIKELARLRRIETRLAELEAEVVLWKDSHVVACRRVEELEAENERLRGELEGRGHEGDKGLRREHRFMCEVADTWKAEAERFKARSLKSEEEISRLLRIEEAARALLDYRERFAGRTENAPWDALRTALDKGEHP